MLKFYIIPALVLSSLIASAQDSTKVRHIRQFMELTGSAKLGIQMLTNITETYKKAYPNANNEFWDQFLKEASADTLMSMIIPVYDKSFSDDDILQLITFYQTPVGKKVIEKMPFIMQESMQIGAAWGKKLSEKVVEQLQQKGYIKNL